VNLGRTARSVSKIPKKLALSFNAIHIPKEGRRWNIARIVFGRCQLKDIFPPQALRRFIASRRSAKASLTFTTSFAISVL
jgi:hypothetical protein